MPSPRPPQGQQATQRRGTIAAAGLALVFIGIIAWYSLRGGSASPAPAHAVPPVSARGGAPDDLKPGDAPAMGASSGVHADITDKDDPRRVIGEFMYENSDPLPGGHVAVEKPQVWLFLSDGRTAHVRSDTGTLYLRGTQPESGTISGNVVVRLFDRRPDGTRIDAEADTPTHTLTTQSMTFNSTLGELNTADRFIFDSAQGQCIGTGLKVVFNQVRERLEFLRIDRGERIVVRPQERAKPAPKPSPAPAAQAAAPPPATPAAPAARPEPPAEIMYEIVFGDKVLVTHQDSTIKSDTLKSWVRTIDGKLPADAVLPIKFASIQPGPAPRRDPAAATTSPAPASPAPSAPPAPTPRTTPAPPAAPEGEVILTWSGPCTIAPLDDAPAELKADHVALRFTAERSGLVELKSTSQGASGHAATIDYAATTGRLAMAGPGPASVLLKLTETGDSLEAVRLEFNLATGIGRIPGPGVLARALGAAGRQQVSWAGQADFMLETRAGEVVQAIKQAICTGGVRFVSGADTLRGEYAQADFTSTPELPGQLSRLILKEGVSGVSERSGSLSAAHVDVAFKPGPTGDPMPTVLTAQGDVRAQGKGSELASDFLEARFGVEPGTDGKKAEVVSALARGGVSFDDRINAVTATADEMIADLHWLPPQPGAPAQRKEQVDLTGQRVVIARADQTTITGAQMRLDGRSNRLDVFGAGTFEHSEEGRSPLLSSAPGPSIVAAWTGGMTFDNTSGLVDCIGSVESTAWPAPFTRDRIAAERLKITLAPEAPGKPAKNLTERSERRDIRTAHAFGSILDREGGANASVESIRYVPDAAAENGLRPEQVYYIEGPKILADQEAGTLDVPHPGRLVVSDRRPDEKAVDKSPGEQPAAGALQAGDARGDTLVDWDGSMHMDRAQGRMDLLTNVRLTHRALTNDQITNLVCEHLIAVFRAKDSASENDPEPGAQPTGLVRAVADGAVYAASGPQAAQGRPFRPLRELIADHAEYDALKGIIQAQAADGNQVTLFDAASGTPQSAAALEWNLKTDRITVTRPQTVTQPIPSSR